MEDVTVHIPHHVRRLWDWVDDPRIAGREIPFCCESLTNDEEYDKMVIREWEDKLKDFTE